MKDIEKIKKMKFPCPCGGKIRWTKERVIEDEIDCGILDIEICDKCGEEYLPDWSMKIVEGKLQEAGLWGTGREEVKFWKTGNTVTLRFPTKFAQLLGLNKVSKGYVYKEGERKLSIEY